LLTSVQNARSSCRRPNVRIRTPRAQGCGAFVVTRVLLLVPFLSTEYARRVREQIATTPPAPKPPTAAQASTTASQHQHKQQQHEQQQQQQQLHPAPQQPTSLPAPPPVPARSAVRAQTTTPGVIDIATPLSHMLREAVRTTPAVQDWTPPLQRVTGSFTPAKRRASPQHRHDDAGHAAVGTTADVTSEDAQGSHSDGPSSAPSASAGAGASASARLKAALAAVEAQPCVPESSRTTEQAVSSSPRTVDIPQAGVDVGAPGGAGTDDAANAPAEAARHVTGDAWTPRYEAIQRAAHTAAPHSAEQAERATMVSLARRLAESEALLVQERAQRVALVAYVSFCRLSTRVPILVLRCAVSCCACLCVLLCVLPWRVASPPSCVCSHLLLRVLVVILRLCFIFKCMCQTCGAFGE